MPYDSEDITVTVLMPSGSPDEMVELVSEGQFMQSFNHKPYLTTTVTIVL